MFKNCSSVTCVRCAIVKHGDTNADIIDGKTCNSERWADKYNQGAKCAS